MRLVPSATDDDEAGIENRSGRINETRFDGGDRLRRE
jgi:hypothetical protein